MNNNIKAGADLHAGDGGYSEGTKEKYDEFAKGRNQSLGNMRIRELAIEADIMAPTWNNVPLGYQKFAELIVAEMLQTCKDHPAWTGRMIGEHIKQHFGVEE